MSPEKYPRHKFLSDLHTPHNQTESMWGVLGLYAHEAYLFSLGLLSSAFSSIHALFSQNHLLSCLWSTSAKALKGTVEVTEVSQDEGKKAATEKSVVDSCSAQNEEQKSDDAPAAEKQIMSRMALNDNKAGMEGLDKERINQIIFEASKGTENT